jgi:hypothetical protein
MSNTDIRGGSEVMVYHTSAWSKVWNKGWLVRPIVASTGGSPEKWIVEIEGHGRQCVELLEVLTLERYANLLKALAESEKSDG